MIKCPTKGVILVIIACHCLYNPQKYLLTETMYCIKFKHLLRWHPLQMFRGWFSWDVGFLFPFLSYISTLLPRIQAAGGDVSLLFATHCSYFPTWPGKRDQ